MQSIIMILLTAALWGCHKEAPMPDPPDPVESKVFELIWSTRLHPTDEVGEVNTQRFVFDELYIEPGDLKDDMPLLTSFDKRSGDIHWTYNDAKFGNTNTYHCLKVGSIIVSRTGKYFYGFDISKNEMIWMLSLTDLNVNADNGVVYNDLVYFSVSENFDNPDETAHLLEIEAATGEHRFILNLKKDSIGAKYMSPPGFRETSEGTIMYYNEYPNYDSPPQDGIQSIVAYNLDTEEEVWRNDGFITEWATNSLHAPVIYEDVLMTGGDYSMYGFDINTGEKIWRTKIPGKDKFASYTNTNHLVVNGKVYANGTGHDLMCLDAKTGGLIWSSTEAPNCTDNMLYYKDMLIFTSWGYGSVMVIDAMTGKTIHRERPYEGSNFNNDIAYDPETDMFFTSTYKHALGFKINKPE